MAEVKAAVMDFPGAVLWKAEEKRRRASVRSAESGPATGRSAVEGRARPQLDPQTLPRELIPRRRAHLRPGLSLTKARGPY
jgi:hypothetical protein